MQAVQSESVLNNELFLINRLLEVLLAQSRSSAVAMVWDSSSSGITARAHFQLRSHGNQSLSSMTQCYCPRIDNMVLGHASSERCVLLSRDCVTATQEQPENVMADVKLGV